MMQMLLMVLLVTMCVADDAAMDAFCVSMHEPVIWITKALEAAGRGLSDLPIYDQQRRRISVLSSLIGYGKTGWIGRSNIAPSSSTDTLQKMVCTESRQS